VLHLPDRNLQDAGCRLAPEANDARAGEIAKEANSLPRDESQRALFLFLTEQWDRYDTLDFDRRLLYAIHETATPPLRQRIAEKLRLAGRTDFLTILAGRDYRARAAAMSTGEVDFLVQMLARNREWERLWKLAFH